MCYTSSSCRFWMNSPSGACSNYLSLSRYLHFLTFYIFGLSTSIGQLGSSVPNLQLFTRPTPNWFFGLKPVSWVPCHAFYSFGHSGQVQGILGKSGHLKHSAQNSQICSKCPELPRMPRFAQNGEFCFRIAQSSHSDPSFRRPSQL